MKKLYVALYAVLLISVIGTVILLRLSPDRIPVHYNFAGEADRIGSKYESLVWPGFTVIMGAFFLLMARIPRKKGESNNEKVVLITGVSTIILFALLGFYFMLRALRYNPEAARFTSYDDVNRAVSIGVGALLVAFGVIMPKMRRNSLFGIRTKWSMANDNVWQKSQRFGGIASVIAGSIMIVLALFIPGIYNILAMTIVIVIWLILCIAASRRFYLEDKDRRAK